MAKHSHQFVADTGRPPFFLSPADFDRILEVEAMCARYHSNPSASIDRELEHMHRDHCYKHRPILGVAHSLTITGDLAFSADWDANRVANMAEALGALDRARVVFELEFAA